MLAHGTAPPAANHHCWRNLGTPVPTDQRPSACNRQRCHYGFGASQPRLESSQGRRAAASMLVELQHLCQGAEEASGQRCQGWYAQPVLLMMSTGRGGTRPQQCSDSGHHSALVSNASPLPVSETCCSWPRASFCMQVMHVIHVMHQMPSLERPGCRAVAADDALASAPPSGRKPRHRLSQTALCPAWLAYVM